MSWYWIVLIVIAYLLMWAVTTAAMRIIDEDYDFYGPIGCIVLGLVWPITFLFAGIYNFSTRLYKTVKKEEKK